VKNTVSFFFFFFFFFPLFPPLLPPLLPFSFAHRADYIEDAGKSPMMAGSSDRDKEKRSDTNSFSFFFFPPPPPFSCLLPFPFVFFAGPPSDGVEVRKLATRREWRRGAKRPASFYTGMEAFPFFFFFPFLFPFPPLRFSFSGV